MFLCGLRVLVSLTERMGKKTEERVREGGAGGARRGKGEMRREGYQPHELGVGRKGERAMEGRRESAYSSPGSLLLPEGNNHSLAMTKKQALPSKVWGTGPPSPYRRHGDELGGSPAARPGHLLTLPALPGMVEHATGSFPDVSIQLYPNTVLSNIYYF